MAHYRAADVALMAPSAPMSRTAQAFVACRPDEDGVLVFSDGAVHGFDEALSAAPHDVGALSNTIDRAVTMPPIDRTYRMKRLKKQVEGMDVHRWADGFLSRIRGTTMARPSRPGSTSRRRVDD